MGSPVCVWILLLLSDFCKFLHGLNARLFSNSLTIRRVFRFHFCGMQQEVECGWSVCGVKFDSECKYCLFCRNVLFPRRSTRSSVGIPVPHTILIGVLDSILAAQFTITRPVSCFARAQKLYRAFEEEERSHKYQ